MTYEIGKGEYMVYTHQEVADMLNVSLSSVKNYIKDLKEENNSIDFNNIDDDVYKMIEDIAIQKNPHVRKFKDLEHKINSLNSEISKKEETINELNETISTMKDNHINDLRESTHKYLSLQEQSNLLLAQLSSNFKALTDQSSVNSSNNYSYTQEDLIEDDLYIQDISEEDAADRIEKNDDTAHAQDNDTLEGVADIQANASGVDLENNDVEVSFNKDFQVDDVFVEEEYESDSDESLNNKENDQVKPYVEEAHGDPTTNYDHRDIDTGKVKVGLLQKLFGRRK